MVEHLEVEQTVENLRVLERLQLVTSSNLVLFLFCLNFVITVREIYMAYYRTKLFNLFVKQEEKL